LKDRVEDRAVYVMRVRKKRTVGFQIDDSEHELRSKVSRGPLWLLPPPFLELASSRNLSIREFTLVDLFEGLSDGIVPQP
jgi:hypothetical protein